MFFCSLNVEMINQSSSQRELIRPHNTKLAYYAKARHFVEWCKDLHIRPIPHADRVAAFLTFRKDHGWGRAQKVNLTFKLSNTMLFLLNKVFHPAYKGYTERIHLCIRGCTKEIEISYRS